MKGLKILKSKSYVILYERALNSKIEFVLLITVKKWCQMDKACLTYAIAYAYMRKYSVLTYLSMRTYISNALHPALVITQKRHILK